MKKYFIWIIALMIALTAVALADKTNADSALDAFNKLTQQTTQPTAAAYTGAKTSEAYLGEIMTGMYAHPAADQQLAAAIAPALDGIAQITSADITAYAASNNIPAEKVRNAYFRSLANVLRAEIMVNPSSEEQLRNTQLVLSLFLYDDDASDAVRDTIRRSMTRENAQTIAANYDLPLSFVEFMIMDDDWDDSDYTNDAAWTASHNYTWSYGDTPDLTPDNTPDHTPDKVRSYTSVAAATKKPASSYTNTPDNTPDRTPDNTPDRNTPDNTPDRNTPDNTPDNT